VISSIICLRKHVSEIEASEEGLIRLHMLSEACQVHKDLANLCNVLGRES